MLRLVATFVVLIFSWQVMAEGDAEYRHEVMEAKGYTMSAIAMILKQEVVRPDDLAPLAAALDELANTAEGLFPEGSEGGEALPVIWENPEDFAEKLAQFKEATKAFRAATASGNMSEIGPATRTLGASCKSCHDDYRE